MSELKNVVIALETEAKQRSDYFLDDAAEAIKNLCEENDELRKDSKDIIENLVIHILETNKTTKINTPPHECEFLTDPERGKCSFCETWGSAMMLVYPDQFEEVD
jgi:hypothetical protein